MSVCFSVIIFWLLYAMFSCHGESLQSIRKGLLRALNLQAEPQLPAGGLDSVRVQWKSIFSTISHRAKDAAGNWNPRVIESTRDLDFSSLRQMILFCVFFSQADQNLNSPSFYCFLVHVYFSSSSLWLLCVTW